MFILRNGNLMPLNWKHGRGELFCAGWKYHESSLIIYHDDKNSNFKLNVCSSNDQLGEKIFHDSPWLALLAFYLLRSDHYASGTRSKRSEMIMLNFTVSAYLVEWIYRFRERVDHKFEEHVAQCFRRYLKVSVHVVPAILTMLKCLFQSCFGKKLQTWKLWTKLQSI